MICVSTNTPEFKTLRSKTGMDAGYLQAYCGDFMEQYGRFPHLDEINGANSEPYLKEALKVNKYNGTKIEKILENRGVDSIEKAVIDINQDHRDLEVSMVPLNEEAIVDITPRPALYVSDFEDVDVDQNVDTPLVFNNMLTKFGKLYGINFNTISDAELASTELAHIASEFSSASAFVYNGNIYINTDKASVDAPLHEMMHIFLGSMRYTDPDTYFNAVNSVESLPYYALIANRYVNRTRDDINEEIFVTEASKYMTGIESVLDKLNGNTLYEILYNICRVLDTALMGQVSVKTITPDILFNNSLKQLTKLVGSRIMLNNFRGTLDVEGSSLHRMLNNKKSDLMKRGTLKEICD